MDIEIKLTEYNQLNSEEKKQAVRDIFEAGAEKLLPAFKGELSRIALRVVADAGRGAAGFVRKNSGVFIDQLHSDDPKVRMLAAEVLGSAGGFSKELVTACHAEQTMFAIPSMLLAVGAQKTDYAKRYLENYTVRSDHEKHIREEKLALQKALANFVERRPTQIRIAPSDVLALSCPNTAVTLAEAKQKDLRARKSGDFILVSSLIRYMDIFALRTFSAAYLLLGTCTRENLTKKLSSVEEAILARMNVTNYRLEVSGVSHQERIAYVKESVAALPRLVNTPSSYSFELRLQVNGNKIILLLDPLLDTRFSYRKRAVSAAISPAVAASVCYAAQPYFNPEARVLDNFCGSGTMLFERSFYPHASLIGVDISLNAITSAKENEGRLKAGAKFFHMDALRFTDRKFDEVICNMPFGLRVGTHARNKELYEAYMAILPRIMEEGGHAFLYTVEKQLLEDTVRRRGYKIVSKKTFSAGGLYPTLYILKF
jgi:23S rRNA G2445 N2-methylase RlmL